jgi:hypothetical protein
MNVGADPRTKYLEQLIRAALDEPHGEELRHTSTRPQGGILSELDHRNEEGGA